MTRRSPTEENLVQTYFKQGWVPVRWSHHPKAVRDAIRRVGMRPMLKQCFLNCQKLLMMSDLEAEYREGWATRAIPIMHSWLVYDGEIVDLTITDKSLRYLDSYAVPKEQISRVVFGRGYWGVIDGERMASISPYREAFEALRKTTGQDLLGINDVAPHNLVLPEGH